MEQIFSSLLDEEFLKFILAMSILMLGNAISGAAKARKAGEFSWKVLLDGCINYVLWGLAATLVVLGANIYGGNLELIIGETKITLLEAIAIAEKSVYIYWAAKGIQNFLEYAKIEKKVEPVDLINGVEGPQENSEEAIG